MDYIIIPNQIFPVFFRAFDVLNFFLVDTMMPMFYLLVLDLCH